WIFNPQLILVDVYGWWQLTMVVLASLTAALVFAAATMGWFQTRSRWYETLVLLIAVFILFRPDFFMDLVQAPYKSRAAKDVYAVAQETQPGYSMVFVIKGTTVEGEDNRKTVSVSLGKGTDARARLSEAGLTFSQLGDEVRVGTVKFGSRGRRAGFEQGWVVEELKVDSEAPSAHWMYIPGYLLVVLVAILQRRRIRSAAPGGAMAAAV
ncbi:MAG: DUF3394 domain-containing protein, partial [Usitatibacter sp.]